MARPGTLLGRAERDAARVRAVAKAASASRAHGGSGAGGPATVAGSLRVRSPFPSTLAGRLAATYAVVVAVVMAAFGVVLAKGVEAVYIDRLAAGMEQEATLIAGMLTGPSDGLNAEQLLDRAADSLDAHLAVIGPDDVARFGGASAGGGEPIGRAELDIVRRTGAVRTIEQVAGAAYLWVAVNEPGASSDVVALGRPLAEVDAAIRRLQQLVIACTLAAIALVAGVGVVVAGRIGRPLQDLRRQAAAVFDGRLDAAVQPAGTREIGELGHAFNAMTARLRDSVDELARTRGRLEATLTSLSDGVAILDPRGGVVLLNPAARTMLAAEDAVGRPFVEAARDHELAALARQAAASVEPVAGTVRHSRSGRTIDATAQRVESGDEVLLLLVLRDVTELRRLENVRREFVANVSHELRTPLASIRAVVETLEGGAIDDPAVSYDFLRRIVGETDRLALLVDDLLDLARLQSGRVRLRIEEAPLAELVAHGVDRLRPQVERARLSLDLDLPEGLPAIGVDRARIEQVLLNLVHNAIKFTPPGGRIRVAARSDDGAVRITVSDDGIGVAPDELPRLFERFYKADKARRSDGTGLGLAIAKHIVQAHGGSITAASEPGRGSTFTVVLPRANRPGAETETRSGSAYPGTMRSQPATVAE